MSSPPVPMELDDDNSDPHPTIPPPIGQIEDGTNVNSPGAASRGSSDEIMDVDLDIGLTPPDDSPTHAPGDLTSPTIDTATIGDYTAYSTHTDRPPITPLASATGTDEDSCDPSAHVNGSDAHPPEQIELTPPQNLAAREHEHIDPPSTPLTVLLTPTTSSFTDNDANGGVDSPEHDATCTKQVPVTYAGRRTVRPVPLRSPIPYSDTGKPFTLAPDRPKTPSQTLLRARDDNVDSAPTPLSPFGSLSPNASLVAEHRSRTIYSHAHNDVDFNGKRDQAANRDDPVELEDPPRGRKRRNSTSLGSPYRPKRIHLRAASLEPSSSDAGSSSLRALPPSRRLTSSRSTSALRTDASGSASSSSASWSAWSPSRPLNSLRPISAHNPFRPRSNQGKSAWTLEKLHVGDPPTARSTTLDTPNLGSDRSEAGHAPERSIRLKKDFTVARGETILRSALHFAALHNEMVDTHCWGCHTSWDEKAQRKGVELAVCKGRYLRCERCQTALWCSLKCYAKNAEGHYAECRALCRSEIAPSAEVRVYAKVFHAMAKNKASSLCFNGTRLTNSVLHFQITILDNDQAKKLRILARRLTTFLSRTHEGDVRVIWDEYKMKSHADVLRFVRQLQAMTLEMRDAYDRPIGLCIVDLPMPTKIRHSCTPNAYVAFPEGLDASEPLRVISLKDIKGGDEVTISYVSAQIPCHMRAATLRPLGFGHDCDECEGMVAGVDPRWASWHENCGTKGRDRRESTRGALKEPGSQAERGMIPLEYDKSALEERICQVCFEPEMTFEQSWDHDRAVETVMQWYTESGADWHIMLVAHVDAPAETQVLRTGIKRLAGHFPETTWPLPLLRHRTASRVLLQRGRSVEDLYLALDDLGHVYTALRTLSGRATTTTLWIRIQMYIAREKIVGRLYRTAEAMRGWQDRRRKEIVGRKVVEVRMRVRAEMEKSAMAGSAALDMKIERDDGQADETENERQVRGTDGNCEIDAGVEQDIDVKSVTASKLVIDTHPITDVGIGRKTDTDAGDLTDQADNTNHMITLSIEEENDIIESACRLRGITRQLGSTNSVDPSRTPRRPKVFTAQNIENEARRNVDHALDVWNTAREEWRELSAGMDGVESGRWVIGRRVEKTWGAVKDLAGWFGIELGLRGAQ